MSSFSGSNIAFTHYHRWYMGAYFQDDWKVSSNLTLNLGLRWDYFTPYAEINGRQANFIAAGGNGSTGTYLMSKQGCQVPRSASFDALLTSNHIALDCVSELALGEAQKTNFAPRLGFAYRITAEARLPGRIRNRIRSASNCRLWWNLGNKLSICFHIHISQCGFAASDSAAQWRTSDNGKYLFND